jgi:hypothetical protein
LIRPTQWDRLALELDNKAGIWSRRFTDFGLIDPVAVTVARRLKIPRPARRARERIERKIIAGLK